MGKESKKEIEKADGINVVRRAVCDIKSAILQSQLRVASAGNRELLMLYFGIGKYISLHSRHHYWGTGAIEKISESLQKEMPGLRGFSAENIKRMRSFYENWGDLEIRSPVATELDGEGVILRNFNMTFGRDFTFVGNQYHLEKFGHDLYPDLLFYNRELACLVAVELKAGDFKPAYLGQLNAYLRVLDDEVKKPFENPSIGIILCKNADKTYVEYLIQGYTTPMGVATYRTREDVLKLLPSEEELRNVLAETPTKH